MKTNKQTAHQKFMCSMEKALNDYDYEKYIEATEQMDENIKYTKLSLEPFEDRKSNPPSSLVL